MIKEYRFFKPKTVLFLLLKMDALSNYYNRVFLNDITLNITLSSSNNGTRQINKLTVDSIIKGFEVLLHFNNEKATLYLPEIDFVLLSRLYEYLEYPLITLFLMGRELKVSK